ncbi:NAD-dependent glutamate dehydrogenase [Savitreella phatthalungensis]
MPGLLATRRLPAFADSATPETPKDHLLQRSGSIGYAPVKFARKLEQKALVTAELKKHGWIPDAVCEQETDYFYDKLGFDDQYFQYESVITIASHILSLYGAKIQALAQGDNTTDTPVRLVREAEDHAVYIDTSFPGVTDQQGPQFEGRLEERYLNATDKVFRVESFRSGCSDWGKPGQELRTYFVSECSFAVDKPEGDDVTDLAKISDKTFLEKATHNTLAIYDRMIKTVVARMGPVMDVYSIQGTKERRLVIGLPRGTCKNFFTALTDLYHYYGLQSSRKYVEQFSNGVCVMSLYLQPANTTEDSTADGALDIDAALHHLITKEASLLFCLPRNYFNDLFVRGELSLQESVYAHCVSAFVAHFLNRLGPEYTSLRQQLDPNSAVHQQLLAKIKRRLREETYTREDVYNIIREQPELVRLLYAQFAGVHFIRRSRSEGGTPDPEQQIKVDRQRLIGRPNRLGGGLQDADIQKLIHEKTNNEHELHVMMSFATFNKHVLKTNFYQPTKTAISFRLDPSFLPPEEYPEPLYGMFLVIGDEFRGTHLRFRDVARGGIRIVKSRTREAYSMNVRGLFDENYALASTQQKKNKDIPEGGAKGVILLDADKQDRGEQAFRKYIDALIDLLLEGHSPGIKDKIVDLYGKEEILFCGPDENTAGLVDWATEHARARGAPWWKSFFTGKSKRLGGIPHDAYGMTSLSVRQYVEGVYEKLGWKEEEVTKIQTGGPDGDLGSNEILLGKEKYVTIIDGAGVLHDPNGLDRSELVRLAKARQMIDAYNAPLSADGYRVLVDDVDLTLPSGEKVANGTNFRNTAHLRDFHAGNREAGSSADMFVPCGGRPEAININNVGQLIDEATGKSRLPALVEGANLFVTQDAKLALEKAGCLVYKDASTNKGGVTSSSLEVLASLSFDDAGFRTHMCVDAHTGAEPAFYRAYVASVQDIIRSNARMEFDAIEREHEATSTPRSLISNRLSEAIVKLQEEMASSSLWQDIKLRTTVLNSAFPPLLLQHIGLDTMLERIPESYVRAIFGCFLASRFVYKHGIAPSPFRIYEFISSFDTQH